MSEKMKLETMPHWIPEEDRHCRACDMPTDHVMVTEGKPYTYPCCTTESCQKIVRDKIDETLSAAKV